ncbi:MULTISPECIES: hypothetical protein [Clostridium]|uniref:hypothetical protein n=1 Tax=Clostridium TaxID=1485 RepID=UPI00189B4EC3|nr:MULTISPECIES: hypothetical protein [Clostridium]MCR1952756.1 hypothetical protein [Clostridium sp. DSM 100503]MDI9217990.1 hypothetical protein [Clostridium tertium]
MKIIKLIVSIIIIIIILTTIYSLSIMNIKNTSIFSWSTKVIKNNDLGNMYKVINDLNISTVYQNLSGLTVDEISGFIENIKSNTQAEVYFLTGDANWYKDVNKFIKRIEFINDYNEKVDNDLKIKAIVLDVEPWTLDEGWDEDEYIKMLHKSYSYCKKSDLELINVIPYWLEKDIIEQIIINSDEIAVMNYNIEKPVKNIKDEVNLSKMYNKKINIIAETQAPNDKYGVTDNTTYYYKGYDALKSDWRKIKKEYKYKGISFSYHDYSNVLKFIYK